MAIPKLEGELGVDEAKGEGDHRTGAGVIKLRVGFIFVMVAVEVVERVKLVGGVGEAAELGESKDVVGKVDEVVVGFG